LARKPHLARRPKRTVAALATGLAAVGVAVGSGADFSAQSANPSNTFSAGSLTIDNSREGAAIFSPDGMVPGAPPKTGTVDIQNSGSIAGKFSLSRDQLASTDTGTPNPSPFAAKVTLTVVDCGAFQGATAPGCGDAGDVTVYDHAALASMSAPLDLGRFGAGERHRYQFAAQLSSSAGNEYEGDSASARFVWDAVQADQ
jgi:spore coat-associated protein N